MIIYKLEKSFRYWRQLYFNGVHRGWIKKDVHGDNGYEVRLFNKQGNGFLACEKTLRLKDARQMIVEKLGS